MMEKEDIEKLAEMIKDAENNRKAFVLVRTPEGFSVHEISEGIAKMALKAEESRLKAVTSK